MVRNSELFNLVNLVLELNNRDKIVNAGGEIVDLYGQECLAGYDTQEVVFDDNCGSTNRLMDISYSNGYIYYYD